LKLSLEEGTFAVHETRQILKNYLNGTDYSISNAPKIFSETRGVFISLYTQSDNNLRGCIGIPEPVMPLKDALKEAAISAAVHDPRFTPITRDELKKIDIEVSILTHPQLLDVENPMEYIKKMSIGKHGLIIEFGTYRGLLLPQIAKEYNWSKKQYLSNLCTKAGMHPTAWLEYDVNIYSFEAQIFRELKPEGMVTERLDFRGCGLDKKL
jgi:uncharacterized protein (TIGR00296 family)